MKIPNNYVLVKPDKEPTSGAFSFDDTFEPGKFVSVTGTVVQVPEKLLYYGAEIARSMGQSRHISRSKAEQLRTMHNFSLEYDTPMELQVGDKVIYRYLENLHTQDDYMLNPMNYEGGIVVRYDSLYARVRDGEIYPLNGLCLIQPIHEKSPMGDDKLPPKMTMKGTVYASGSPVKYKDDVRQQLYHPCKKGEVVIFKRHAAVPLEFELFDNALGLWKLPINEIFGTEITNNQLHD